MTNSHGPDEIAIIKQATRSRYNASHPAPGECDWLAPRLASRSYPHSQHLWWPAEMGMRVCRCGMLVPRESADLVDASALPRCAMCAALVQLEADRGESLAQKEKRAGYRLAKKAALATARLRPAPLAACQSGHR